MNQLLDQGRVLARQGQYAAATSAWLAGLEATTAISEEPFYWIELGAVLRITGQAEQALALHQYVQPLCQDSYQRSVLDLNLAADLLALQQSDLACKALARAQQFPNFALCPRLQELLSQLHTQLGQLDLAEQALERALALYQDYPLALASCSLALLKLFAQTPDVDAARLSAVIEIAQQHIELLPNEAREMQIVLARACQMLGRNREAVQLYGNAHALPVTQKNRKPKPRRLSTVEYKLKQITSEIEIELLREKNAVQHLQVQQLESIGFRDELTGLYNARYLEMRWPELFEHMRESGSLCLLSLGIDLFASITEVLGKELALILYTQIARILQAAFPPDSILVSAGSESFAAVLFDSNKAQIEAILHSVHDKIAYLEQFYLPEPLRVSAGGAFYQPGETPDVLQLRSNLALFLAQRQEKGQICWDGELP